MAVFLLVLLTVLGTLQYRWLGRATEADRLRTANSLSAATERFAADFDHELASVLISVAPASFPPAGTEGDDGSRIRRRLDAWRDRARWPGLVEGVWHVPGRGEPAQDGAEIRRLDQQRGVFVPAELPVDLDRLIDGGVLEPGLRSPALAAGLSTEAVALVLPWNDSPDPPSGAIDQEGDPDRHLGQRMGGRMRHHPGGPPGELGHREPAESHLVLRLNGELLEREVFPTLAARHFSVDEENLVLRVVAADAVKSVETVWRRGELPRAEPGGGLEPVAAEKLFSPRRLLHRHGGFGSGGQTDQTSEAGPWHHLVGAGMRRAVAEEATTDRVHWRLEVIHRAGSLDAAVATARRNGLALSLGILLVLAFAVLLQAQGLRRVQVLARRQLEFVAGVSHELRTPIAALRSAGQNLADGVVDGERVARYGRLVDREGRRLEETVDQILAFAGLQSGGLADGTRLDRVPLNPEREAESALDDLAALFEEEGVEVELRADPHLPKIHADRAALASALRNLLVNAVRHGTNGEPWVGLHLSTESDRVVFRVRDRGPGVAPDDRSRIFDPFVRGSGLAASNVPGNGLGLALVRRVAEAHGGAVRLETEEPWPGAVFVLELPAKESAP
ncbi:MAG: sensor histidine kinase [bacterium]